MGGRQYGAFYQEWKARIIDGPERWDDFDLRGMNHYSCYGLRNWNRGDSFVEI